MSSIRLVRCQKRVLLQGELELNEATLGRLAQEVPRRTEFASGRRTVLDTELSRRAVLQLASVALLLARREERRPKRWPD